MGRRLAEALRTLRCRSRREEFEQVFDNAVGRFLLQVVAGWKRLRIDEIARELAPHRRIFRRSSGSPQYQQRHADLAVPVGRIHLEIDRGEFPIPVCSRTFQKLG